MQALKLATCLTVLVLVPAAGAKVADDQAPNDPTWSFLDLGAHNDGNFPLIAREPPEDSRTV